MNEKAVNAARSVAVTVLERVFDKGAYAAPALDAELSRARVDPRDAALVTEIVYGTLRVLPALDEAIAARVTQDPERMDPFTRAALRSAAYQLAHLGRLPVHAIVDETVSIVRMKRGQRLGGFANAVLRKLAATRPEAPEPPQHVVVPAWMRTLLERSLGAARTAHFLEQRALPPPLCLRLEDAGSSSRAALRAAIAAAAPEAELHDCVLSPLGLSVRRAGAPRALSGYREGAFTVQDEGSQLVALALGVQPGESIADVCAGHGGKTTLFARQVGDTGRVLSLDRDERKLEQIAPELARIGLPRERLSTLAVDMSVGLGGLEAEYDRVLVDAPCTGFGTIHRRPELLLRAGAGDPSRLSQLQRAILARASGLVRPGGTLAYAVCSPTAAEGPEVAHAFEVAHRAFERIGEPAFSTLPPPDDDGVTRIGPWLVAENAVACPDAYQIVMWRRVR